MRGKKKDPKVNEDISASFCRTAELKIFKCSPNVCNFFANIFEVVQLHFHLTIKQFRFSPFLKVPKMATVTTKVKKYICSDGSQWSIQSISIVHTWWLFRPKSVFEVGNFKKIFLGPVNPQISKKKFFGLQKFDVRRVF